MRILRLTLCCVLFSLFHTTAVRATHLRSADLIITSTADPLTFKITLIVYKNSLSNTRVGGGYIDYGDGRADTLRQVFSPLPSAVSRPDLGENIQTVTFTLTHRYSGHGIYQISYIEGDRSSGIINITDAGDVKYMTGTSFDTRKMENNTLPVLSIPPVDRACSFNTFTHNPGVMDAEGDLITFELTTPNDNKDHPIGSYVSPDNRKFYVDYEHGNEEATGRPAFSIDSLTGQMVWDAPGMSGEYNVAFKVYEWRKDVLTDTYELLSTTIRDMQIVVEDCINKRPVLSTLQDRCILAGTDIDAIIYGTDPEQALVKMEGISEVFDLPVSPASYTPFPAEFRLPNPTTAHDSLIFHWNTECNHIRTQPYGVIFKISDKPPHEISLVSYKSWSIKVMGPAPQWKKPKIDLVKRQARLSWGAYECGNADKIQVWRRVDAYPYNQPQCEVGIPKNLDFDLIGEVSGMDTVFVDNNNGQRLTDGAAYCYRLVAVFNQTVTAYSKVSEAFCFDPIQTDAPVITHVTVDSTSTTNGQIRVSWRSPFNINKSQFPEPYDYHLYRQYGFANDLPLQEVGVVRGDTTFLDQELNTHDSVYHYQIIVYAKPSGHDQYVPVDTSAIASSIQLALIPGAGKMTLVWRDSVPWSNVPLQNPWHVIYRKARGVDDDFVKFDSVNVAEEGYQYVDEPVDIKTIYAYKVLSRGTYGNPLIALQENYSQVTESYPVNDLVLCAPVLIVHHTDCEQYLAADNCGQHAFENVIHWRMDDSDGCRQDVSRFILYAADSPGGEFHVVNATITDTLFNDVGLQSFAKCYKVSMVDFRGLEGPQSGMSCNDNCGYFELPNVFTPNSDGCNDVFTTYRSGEEHDGCMPTNVAACDRFVKSVNFYVYNRWGNEVYHYQSGDGKPAIVRWDGKDRSHDDVDVGTYYFHVSVVFDVLDPAARKGEYKGWVQVVR